MHVIGTAGHVDHGKTKLVQALTGTDTDRLPEEKQRGLTIDLGFAHFRDQDGQEIGVIDVPGHERFIRNMVAGAWSVDCALLVVAANEGWMPQSADHVQVLSHLRIPRLIAVITKSDLVEPAQAELVREEVVERSASMGAWTPESVVVSAEQNTNIDQLEELICRVLSSVSSVESTPPYVYVDRVFTIQGAGTIVTGSLKGGTLTQGSQATILPLDEPVRIRRIQSYNRDVEVAHPVTRVALNLTGGELSGIKRGCCIVGPGSSFRSENEFIARMDEPVSTDAKHGHSDSPQMKNHAEVEVALGTGHQTGRVHVLANPSLVRVVLSASVAATWGQRFLMMQRGGSRILGGGSVVWFGPTERRIRNRLSVAFQESEGLPADLLHLEILVKGAARCPADLIGELTQDRSLTVLTPWVFDAADLAAARTAILAELSQNAGVGAGDLAEKMALEAEPLQAMLDDMLRSGDIVASGSGLQLAGASRGADLSPFTRQVLADLVAAGGSGMERGKLKKPGVLKELRALARLELAVSLNGDIYYARETYDALVEMITTGLEKGTSFSIGEARERTGLSRKYLIPLLNKMESAGIVRRDGDLRTVVANQSRGQESI